MSQITLAHGYPLRVGGASSLNLDLAKYLTGEGWETVLLSPLNKDRRLFNLPISVKNHLKIGPDDSHNKEILLLNLGSKINPFMKRTIKNCLARKKNYLVWFHINIGDSYFKNSPEYLKRTTNLRKVLNCELCLGVICVSQAVKKGLSEIGINQRKLQVIYPGINTPGVEKSSRGIRGDILYAGRLEKYKNLEVLLKSLVLVKKEVPSIKLTIIGNYQKNGYAKGLKSMVRTLGLLNNVIFAPFIPRKRFVSTLKRYKIFCLPSLTESFGIVAIEAILRGVPVITSDVPGLKEVLENGKYGVLFENNNPSALAYQIIRTLKNYNQVLKKAKRGKEVFQKKFDPKKQWGQYQNYLSTSIFWSYIFNDLKIKPTGKPNHHYSEPRL